MFRILATHVFSFILFAHQYIIHIITMRTRMRRRRRKSKLFGESMRLLKFIELAFIFHYMEISDANFSLCILRKKNRKKRAVTDSSLSHFLPRCANTFSNRTARPSTNYKHLPRRQGRFHSSTHSHAVRCFMLVYFFFLFSLLSSPRTANRFITEKLPDTLSHMKLTERHTILNITII